MSEAKKVPLPEQAGNRTSRNHMKPRRLILASLRYYWRTNAAVVLGVATAVAVLAGALLVGDSVRGSLRDLVLQRLGRTDQVVLSAGFFREQLAEELRAHPNFGASFDGICPIVMMPGFVTVQSGSGRAGKVLVYGVDDRFWRFHGIGAVSGPEGREALLSPALARELGAQAGATILVRVERPSDVPLESLHGRKADLGRTLRATVRAVIPREMLGEFSLQAQQGEIRAVFLPLALLQQDLEIGRRVNALLISAKPASDAASTTTLEQLVRSEAELEDLGLNLRILDARRAISLEAEGGLLDPAKAVRNLDTMQALSVLGEYLQGPEVVLGSHPQLLSPFAQEFHEVGTVLIIGHLAGLGRAQDVGVLDPYLSQDAGSGWVLALVALGVPRLFP